MADFKLTSLRSVELGVPDVRADAKFYAGVWNLEQVAEREGAVYLRGTGAHHHILALHPRPKVDSAVVVLDPKPKDYESDPQTLHDLVSASFRMRRKKLVNNLIGWQGRKREEIVEAMVAAGINPDARAETMDLQAFDRLLRHL